MAYGVVQPNQSPVNESAGPVAALPRIPPLSLVESYIVRGRRILSQGACAVAEQVSRCADLPELAAILRPA